MEKMNDISFERHTDGAIRLIQTGCGVDSIIDLAPSQLRYIAMHVAGFKEIDATRVADLERRIGILASRIEKITLDDNLRDDIAERCRDGLWIISQLDGLLDLAVEFDGGRLLPDLKFSPPEDGHESGTAATPSGSERIAEGEAAEAEQFALTLSR